MKIIFNAYALIQLLIIAPIMAIIILVDNYYNLKLPEFLNPYTDSIYSNSFNSIFKDFFFFITVILLAMYLDIKGLRGRFFHIVPTWLIFIVYANLYFYRDGNNIYYTMISISLVFTTIYFFYYKKILIHTWKIKKQNLRKLKTEKILSDKKEFWQLVSHTYFNPPILFLYLNFIWKFLFKSILKEEEFLSFYKDFINIIDLEDFNHYGNSSNYFEYKSFIISLKKALNNATTFKQYRHPFLGFERFAMSIDYINKRLDKTIDK